MTDTKPATPKTPATGRAETPQPGTMCHECFMVRTATGACGCSWD